MAAVVILAFIAASVWTVIENCMMGAADMAQRMRAFDIAREKMEQLLSAESIELRSELGMSEKYPDIQWQTTIETVTPPGGSKSWAQAVCSAEYTDAQGQTQTVELTCWLTELTKEQMEQLSALSEAEQQLLEQYIVQDISLAAQYAGVTSGTIQQWVANGMPTTAEGFYLKPILELYSLAGGRPTPQEKADLVWQYPELASVLGGSRTKSPGIEPTMNETELPMDLPMESPED